MEREQTDKDKQDVAVAKVDGNGFGRPLTLTIDYARYQHYLDDGDLTEDQKREFLDTIWSIIVGFVDLGFGVHPLQQACGQFDQKSAEVLAFESAAMIGSDGHSRHTINPTRAMDNDDSKAERKET